MDKRKIFVSELVAKARKNKNIILLTADLGYNVLEPFQKEFPKQFYNVGVIEQTMAGIATGLALAGKEVYIYSGAIFLNYRCIEAIRNAWEQGIDVKVVGVCHSGFLGNSHNFMKGEREPLKHLAKLLKKTYIRL